VLVITANVTERRNAEMALRVAEEQLHQAQRMETIGQLAGGIAHDFNNLLQVLEGTLYFAKEGIRLGKPVAEELEQAIQATARAAELTSDLSTIGRRKRLNPKRVELGELVERSMRMFRRAIPENIALRYVPWSGPCFVQVDAPQFDQVLINLCVNARDAMPAGGKLTISVETDGTLDAVVSVADTGEGIPQEHLARVFEPFFTTKRTGSGLGLAVAAGIVASHGGVLLAESIAGQGTTMKIRLPRSTEGGVPSASATDRVPAGGNELVLIAEDEPSVRTQVVRILESAGYEVLQASNGAEALELFRSRSADIDLVLLDAIMPELDGWQTFLEIEKVAPSARVLFSTGYAANVLPKDLTTHGFRVLSKPYKAEALLAYVREVLDCVD
jgi:two-component system NtrC family sensor kinase